MLGEATNDRESFNLGPRTNKYFKIPQHKYLVSIKLKILWMMRNKYIDYKIYLYVLITN